MAFRFIIIPVISVIIAQLIKFTVESLKSRKLEWARLLNGNGGMPSSHTSFVFSLTMSIGFEYGFDNVLFAISLIFSLITAYDAMGLRMQSEKQAETINDITDIVFKKETEKVKKLKEQIGHEPLEVLMGVVLATIVSYIYITFVF